MIASLHRNSSCTARERSSHSAAKQVLSSIIFWFIGELFYSVNALIYLFYYVKTAISLLFYHFLPYNTLFYCLLDIGDRREPVQPCAELFLCVIIPGWGGVWPFMRDFLIICTNMTRRCDFMVDFALAQRCTSNWIYTSLLHWCVVAHNVRCKCLILFIKKGTDRSLPLPTLCRVS